MPEGDQASLDPELLRRVEAARARFKEAWDSHRPGKTPPSVDHFIGDAPEPERSWLRQELSKIDGIHRGQLTAPTIILTGKPAENRVPKVVPADRSPAGPDS